MPSRVNRHAKNLSINNPTIIRFFIPNDAFFFSEAWDYNKKRALREAPLVYYSQDKNIIVVVTGGSGGS